MPLAVDYLGRHVFHGAAKAVRLAVQRLLRQSEIGERYVALLVQEDVLRFQVPIDDPDAVQVVQRQRQFGLQLNAKKFLTIENAHRTGDDSKITK